MSQISASEFSRRPARTLPQPLVDPIFVQTIDLKGTLIDIATKLGLNPSQYSTIVEENQKFKSTVTLKKFDVEGLVFRRNFECDVGPNNDNAEQNAAEIGRRGLYEIFPFEVEDVNCELYQLYQDAFQRQSFIVEGERRDSNYIQADFIIYKLKVTQVVKKLKNITSQMEVSNDVKKRILLQLKYLD